MLRRTDLGQIAFGTGSLPTELKLLPQLPAPRAAAPRNISAGFVWWHREEFLVHRRPVAASAWHPHWRRDRQRDCLRHHRGRGRSFHPLGCPKKRPLVTRRWMLSAPGQPPDRA